MKEIFDTIGGKHEDEVQTMLKLMNSESKQAEMIRQELPGMDLSPAEIFADIINVARADNKRMAEHYGVEQSIDLMDESKAADLLVGITSGDGAADLIGVFNGLAQQRHEILRNALNRDEFEAFMMAKTDAMYSEEPETWDYDEKPQGE